MSTFVDDMVKAAMAPKQHYEIVKLPCCGTNIQIQRIGDQYVTCPRCHRHSAITWGLKKTITTEG